MGQERLPHRGRSTLLENKRGARANDFPPVLERLVIEPCHWLRMTRQFKSCFSGFVGKEAYLKQACQLLGYRRTIGLSRCHLLLG